VQPVDAVLAPALTGTGDPQQPATEFPEDISAVHLVVRGPANAGLVAKWIAVQAEGYDADQEVQQSRFTLGPDGKGSAALAAGPRVVLRPGAYRVDLTVNGAPGPSLPFRIVSILPAAAAFEEGDRLFGRNIAAAALGGQVESVPANAGAPAEYLNDGGSDVTSRLQQLRPWVTRDATFPQEIVFSFHQWRRATVAAVLIDTDSDNRYTGYLDTIPRHVEVWVATTGAAEDFRKVAAARLPRRAGRHLIAFDPAPASRLKLRVLSNHGGSRTEIVEVQVLEDPSAESILADRPANLALPALGGTVVRLQDATGTPVGNLFDGRVGDHGWYTQERLPREIVLAFRDRQEAYIDRIVVNPSTDLGRETWVKRLSVQVSAESPFDGWREVGRFTVAQGARDQAFPIRRRARFLKLRLLENYGGRQTSLGEVQVLEGRAEGYRSVLLERPPRLLARAAQPEANAAVPAGAADEEREPNNDPAQALRVPLGRRVRGTIAPTGDVDHFAITVPPPAPALLTVELGGHPSIRTALELLDPKGRQVRRFGPGQAGRRTTAFTWLVEPGEYLVRLLEPPISIVLAFDTSGSMGGAIKDLEAAVTAYVDAVQPTEQVALVRFGAGSPNEIVVLTERFTSDRARLRQALAGQFKAVGGTPLYDAVARGIELLRKTEGNRAVVVMTDGEDSGSKLTLPGFWDLLEETRVPVYAILLGNRLQQYHPGLGTSIRGLFSHLSAATQARAYFTPDSAALRGLYEQIAAELRTPVRYTLRMTASPGLGTLRVETGGEPVGAPPQMVLILDASGSMKRRIEGRLMIDIAKDALAQVVKALPDQVHVGLRVYGHRVREGRPEACQDSELVVPIGPLDRSAMLAAIRRVQALGTTPIAYALRQVARDFGTRHGEKMVILVTDGQEECGGSPAAVVSELLAAGVTLRLNIVGFALADARTRREMARVAALTGGAFFDARDGRALRAAIDRALAFPFEVLEATGRRVGGGVTGTGVGVPQGVYTVVLRPAGAPVTIRDVRVRHAAVTRVVLTKDGGEIGFRVIGPPE
jgi:Mg-chelatase subunit ChlD